MAFLRVSTHAEGAKLRFRRVNMKHQNKVEDRDPCSLLLEFSVFGDNTQVLFPPSISLRLQINKHYLRSKYMHELQMMDK